VPRLILLNGPPGCGKSTLARRYIADHPRALNLDIDRLRDLIGGDLRERGLLAREIALQAARTHLEAGHDVIVPQYLGRPEFPARLEALAAELAVPFHDIALFTDAESALRRFRARGGVEAGDEELAEMHGRLVAMIEARGSTVVETADGEVDKAYAGLLAALRS
jgi:predicted kinase